MIRHFVLSTDWSVCTSANIVILEFSVMLGTVQVAIYINCLPAILSLFDG